MDGFVEMTSKFWENALLLVSLIKEGLASIMGDDLGLMIEYAYTGLIGLSSW